MSEYKWVPFVGVLALAAVIVGIGILLAPTPPRAAGGEFRAAQGHRELFYMSADGDLIVGGDVTARDVACAWAKDRGRAPKDCP